MAEADARTGLKAGPPAPRPEAGLPLAVAGSVALHAALVAAAVFDFGLFGSRLEEPPVLFAVGLVPLSELTAAPELGEVTPPRPLEVLDQPAGNEAREVDTVDAEAPEQAPGAEPAPDSQAPEVTEAPPDDIPVDSDLEVATADTPPPPALSAPQQPVPDSAQPDAAAPEVAQPDVVAEADTPPPPVVPPERAASPDPQADPVAAPPVERPDAPQVAALEAPRVPDVPQPPAEREDDPTVPPPPLPPDRTAQARVRPDTPEPEDEPEEDPEDEEPVEAAAPPTEEPAPEPPQVAEFTVPPPPAFTPERERAPEPERPVAPPPTVVDNNAPPPERPSAIDSVLANLGTSSAANTGQGTGRDTGTGGTSGSGNAASGARLAGATLTLSEEEALRAQFRGCWNIPAGARDVENMAVTIRTVVNPDRSVQGAEILDPQNRMAADSYFRTFAESARRAVLLCSPLALPADKYAEWNVINLNFRPDM